MLYSFKRQLIALSFIVMIPISSLGVSIPLTENQLHAVLGIVTNYLLSDNKKPSKVKKTGQTKSYDENGNEVPDDSIKDDGYYQTGVTLRYSRDDANNIVTDNITGLQWQDDADVKTVKKPWLTQTNFDICRGDNGQTQDTAKCTDTSGDTAATYCANLTLDVYTDWRLPTIDELTYIVDRSKIDQAIDTTYFQNAISHYYWSSTTRLINPLTAWKVGFYDGHVGGSVITYSYYVRCVRDVE